jgi:hypothetical protein
LTDALQHLQCYCCSIRASGPVGPGSHRSRAPVRIAMRRVLCRGVRAMSSHVAEAEQLVRDGMTDRVVYLTPHISCRPTHGAPPGRQPRSTAPRTTKERAPSLGRHWNVTWTLLRRRRPGWPAGWPAHAGAARSSSVLTIQSVRTRCPPRSRSRRRQTQVGCSPASAGGRCRVRKAASWTRELMPSLRKIWRRW